MQLNEIDLNPQFILTDFEQAVINYSKRQYPDTYCKGCLFHLGQSVWRQIQAYSFSKKYGENKKNLSIFYNYILFYFLNLTYNNNCMVLYCYCRSNLVPGKIPSKSNWFWIFFRYNIWNEKYISQGNQSFDTCAYKLQKNWNDGVRQ